MRQIGLKDAIGKELTRVYNPFDDYQLYLVFGEEFVLVSADINTDSEHALIDYGLFNQEGYYARGLIAGILTEEEFEIAREKSDERKKNQRRAQYELLKKEFEKND